MHVSRNQKASIFSKVIGISPDDFFYIEKLKGKKSKAGMLKLIINDYRERYGEHS